jgi:hypothetical protein
MGPPWSIENIMGWAGDEKREPLAVVQQCLKFWNDLIATGRFVEPPNPFVRPSSKSEPDSL